MTVVYVNGSQLIFDATEVVSCSPENLDSVLDVSNVKDKTLSITWDGRDDNLVDDAELERIISSKTLPFVIESTKPFTR